MNNNTTHDSRRGYHNRSSMSKNEGYDSPLDYINQHATEVTVLVNKKDDHYLPLLVRFPNDTLLYLFGWDGARLSAVDFQAFGLQYKNLGQDLDYKPLIDICEGFQVAVAGYQLSQNRALFNKLVKAGLKFRLLQAGDNPVTLPVNVMPPQKCPTGETLF